MNESTLHGRNIHGELLDATSNAEDRQDIVRMIAQWLTAQGMTPLSWKAGNTGLGTFMYVTKFEEDGQDKWLAFDAEADVGDVFDREPIPSEFS